jgi:hypothetical protein
VAFEFLRRRPTEVAAETTMTPLEAAADPAVWRQLFKKRSVPPRTAIKKFTRRDLAANATFYSAGTGAKTLVVGLCGKRLRLLMPLPMMLQHTNDLLYDVLILSDPHRLHFDRGIGNFATSLTGLARRIESIATEHGHTSIVTYGTSMGGFPSLRIGGLLGAERSISAGGRFPYHVKRLIEGDQTINAFDLICNCRAPLLTTPGYVLFSEHKRQDLESATMLAQIVPQSRLCGFACDSHNFPIRIYSKGNLAEYFDEIFDLDREPDLERLAAMAV